jgi:pantetheine-phosphate adenylyltransferase
MMRGTSRKAVYAGSFDPVTNGHLWMIKEAASLFDELVVALGVHPDKKYNFTVEDRLFLLEKVTENIPNLKIDHFQGKFLVDYAQSIGANYIVRGIRSSGDYEYERTMRHINSDMHPNVSTVFLLPPRDIAEVSSTMVKGLVGPEGWEMVVGHYVPKAVYEFLLCNKRR